MLGGSINWASNIINYLHGDSIRPELIESPKSNKISEFTKKIFKLHERLDKLTENTEKSCQQLEKKITDLTNEKLKLKNENLSNRQSNEMQSELEEIENQISIHEDLKSDLNYYRAIFRANLSLIENLCNPNKAKQPNATELALFITTSSNEVQQTYLKELLKASQNIIKYYDDFKEKIVNQFFLSPQEELKSSNLQLEKNPNVSNILEFTTRIFKLHETMSKFARSTEKSGKEIEGEITDLINKKINLENDDQVTHQKEIEELESNISMLENLKVELIYVSNIINANISIIENLYNPNGIANPNAADLAEYIAESSDKVQQIYIENLGNADQNITQAYFDFKINIVSDYFQNPDEELKSNNIIN